MNLYWEAHWDALGPEDAEDLDLREHDSGSIVAWLRRFRKPDWGYEVHTLTNAPNGEHILMDIEEAKAYVLLLVRMP
jgi:hypothetical protein